MDRTERQRIYDLLSRFFPNAKQLKDKKTLTAWGLALEHFTYQDVKTAVISYAISNKYFPDLADITAGLPRQVTVLSMPEEAPPTHFTLQGEWRRIYRSELRRELERLGLPEPHGDTGADLIRWIDTCAAAGLDVGQLCERAYRAAVASVGVST